MTPTQNKDSGPTWKWLALTTGGVLGTVLLSGMGLTSSFVMKFSNDVQENTKSIIKVQSEMIHLKEGQDDIKEMLK